VIIRSTTTADVPAVSACVDAAYRHYVDRIGKLPGPMLDDYADVIAQHQVSVVETEGIVVGVIVLAITDEGLLLDNVAVLPQFRGKGIGRRLLEFAEAEAKRLEYSEIYLYTHEKMTENQGLYLKIGYVEYDRRFEKGFSRVYMKKRLL
jgi:ribosomal protein S18 acetylase RimI-like enzyme